MNANAAHARSHGQAPLVRVTHPGTACPILRPRRRSGSQPGECPILRLRRRLGPQSARAATPAPRRTGRIRLISPPHRALLLLAPLALSLLTACQSPGRAQTGSNPALNERHARLYSDAELPRSIGTVENAGLQIPVVSPDGRHVLYVRTDRDYLAPLTLLGSPDPRHTPADGSLSIWLRTLEGASPGWQLTRQRWTHSPVWSDSGHAVAYVVNDPPESYIVHLDLETNQETRLGVPAALNALPRFDGNDQSILFCAAKTADGPFRVYSQSVGAAEPTPLTPPGPDCLFPITTDGRGTVLCAQTEADHLNWIRSGTSGTTTWASRWGDSDRSASLQTWAGIGSPLSPGRDAILFYDGRRDRIGVLHIPEQLIRWHRQRTIAACWIDEQTIATATPDGVFVVNTITGMSTSLFNGRWIPCRYVPATRSLILLGSQTPRRFAIWEVTFKLRASSEQPRPASAIE